MALHMLDAETWQIIRTVQLPKSSAYHLSRDPQGRLWVGYDNLFYNEQRLQVLMPDSHLVKTLLPCNAPDGGVHFYQQQSFIICKENGFFASIAILDQRLATTKSLRLEWADNDYTVYTSGGNQRYVIIAGLVSGPGETAHTVLTLFDMQVEQVMAQLSPLADTHAGDILSHNDHFYLFNDQSWRFTDKTPSDVVVVTPSNPPLTSTLTTAVRAPNYGAVIGENLFTYHNPILAPNFVPDRAIARLNLRTGDSQSWPLPDYWDANDLAVADGKILLTRSDGLYQFDPITGQLTGLASIPFAGQIIVVE
jgi:hypothetical protein